MGGWDVIAGVGCFGTGGGVGIEEVSAAEPEERIVSD